MDITSGKKPNRAAVTFESFDERSVFGSNAPRYRSRESFVWFNDMMSGVVSLGLIGLYPEQDQDYPQTIEVSKRCLAAILANVVSEVDGADASSARAAREIGESIAGYFMEQSVGTREMPRAV